MVVKTRQEKNPGRGYARCTILVGGLLAIALLSGPLSASARTARVSVSSSGAQGDAESREESISATGRFVAFTSDAKNLVSDDTNGKSDVFVRDQLTRQTTRVSVNSKGQEGNGASSQPSISADGRFVAMHSKATNLVSLDTNRTGDVFVTGPLW